jgi:hypothetical protein
MLTKIICGLLLTGLVIYVWGLFFPSPLRMFVSGPREIRFILPASFKGPFIIVPDERGDDLQEVGGVFFVTVPPTRIARVRSVELFAAMHKESWTTVDNRSTVRDANIGATDSETALRCIGSQSCGNTRDRIKYFLGTLQEAETFDFCSIDVP